MNRWIIVLAGVALLAFSLLPMTAPAAGQTVPGPDTPTATRTSTATATRTPTPTATPIPLRVFVIEFHNFPSGQSLAVLYEANACLAPLSNYEIGLDYGDGRPIYTATLTMAGCPGRGAATWLPPQPAYPVGAYTLTATLRQVAPARMLAATQTAIAVGPIATFTRTATPTNTATPTRTNTPFTVSNRTFLGLARR